MSQPSVTLNQLDGALGILGPSVGKVFAVVGPSSAGVANVPAAYGAIKPLSSDFGVGPGVEALAHYIERYGRPGIFVKTATSVPAACSAVTQVGTGTSVATIHTTPTPNDDYGVLIKVIAGGTVGVAGITYQVSFDGGRNFGPVLALGTANDIVLAGAGGVQVDLTHSTNTLVAGDTIAFTTTAATWNSSDLTAALTALSQVTQAWRDCEIVGPFDGNAFDATDTAFAGMAPVGKYRMWIGSFRIPNAGESEATYKAAFDTAFGAKAGIYGGVAAGATKLLSSLSGRKYRRPFGFVAAARQASVSEQINIAALNLGSLPGCSIRDDNGNPDEHDESINPGLDDSRAIVARTWEGIQGVFVNRPLILSQAGSDFDILPKREVMNLALEALRLNLVYRVNVEVRVDPKTGFIFEPDARDIEAGARAAMTAAVMDVPKASAVTFVLSRTDNLLSTKKFTGQARVTPLGYPEAIVVDVGFENPALQVVTA